MTTEAIRVLIADDQRVVRDGLSMLVALIDDVEVVGTACDGAEAVRLAAAHRPDVVMMDLRMPGTDGITATADLRERQPAVRVLVLTAREAEVLTLLASGLSNAEIAGHLFLSHATVKTHINRIFAKTGARDRAQAVRYAYQHGMATPSQ